VDIAGSTFVAVPGTATTETAGGLLTQPSNIGGFEHDEFAVVPEFGVNLKYQISCCLEASFGYTLIYFSDVARPGDQVDLRVDPRQITDPAAATPFPAFNFADSDYWVQGINAGLELRF
jgi:Putative beta barrel porin-7 (BBP7)